MQEGKYFARFKVGGKLIRQSLEKTRFPDWPGTLQFFISFARRNRHVLLQSVIDLQFQHQTIRDEIRAEHTLIANRLAWYVTSQSFLVTAFAISRGNGFVWFPWFSTILLPAIGFTASALIFPSIAGACQTIKLWHRKQRAFFESNPEFKHAFSLERPKWIDTHGLLFPKLMPLLFGLFWAIVAIGSIYLK